eukprot:6129163-Prymnesium_polylepis.1
MQLLYNAVNMDFVTQYAVVRAMRHISAPSKALGEALRYILLYAYGAMRIGLTLGGRDSSLDVTAALLMSGDVVSTPDALLFGTSCDSGHAEP